MKETGSGLVWMEAASPIGTLTLVRSEKGLCHIEFGGWNERGAALTEWASRWFPGAMIRQDEEDSFLLDAARQLTDYFRGNLTAFGVKLDLRGTEFQIRVWKALCEVPHGVTAAYRDIAAAVGAPKAVRAVGGANNRNPVPIIVPCHRIIGADGSMVGYGGGLSIKESLLKLEGIG